MVLADYIKVMGHYLLVILLWERLKVTERISSLTARTSLAGFRITQPIALMDTMNLNS